MAQQLNPVRVFVFLPHPSDTALKTQTTQPAKYGFSNQS